MREIRWDEEKNKVLIRTRGVSFDEVKDLIENNQILDIIKVPNNEKYPNQKGFVLKIRGYVHLVPFVQDSKTIFLKTVIPNRKLNKKYGK
jgi:uncharacterized DUF497 family protein